jgi:hypothetical protein
MPTLGYIKKQNGFFQGIKTAEFGGSSDLFDTFEKARAFVNGSIGMKAKIVDATVQGPAGPHGGPTTWRVYTPG